MTTPKRTLFSDASTWSLLISNIFMIFWAVYQQWPLLSVMWVYWWQSVIIGFSTFIKILLLQNFLTENFTINDRPVKPTRSTKLETAFFFLFHYGFFHLAYFGFLRGGLAEKYSGSITIDAREVGLAAFLFFFHHLFSMIYNFQDRYKKQNIGQVMFFPYARILPMHLIIVFGNFLIGGSRAGLGLIFFLSLKTLADLIMHRFEHIDMMKKGSGTF